ncbi:membrane protein [Asticcacaulis biprosthecium C19]|uniref:Membrane protein n=1 Tax=Asticcacaulis biprosthecium C19 TaxID=715226 RepID=F4QJH0_9CAUL|nr:hypothetical protein [Asticcacaulis biprosthecium]EGF93153.1 membrane protein [Asticcacaulis biprosthecium C19]
MTTTHNRTPWHLWLIGGVLLVFNGFGAVDMTFSLSQPQTYNQMSGMTVEQIAWFDGFPAWVTIAWIASVVGGLLGAVTLLVRSSLAGWLLGVSTAATTGYVIYGYALSSGIAAMGAIWFMPAVVAILTGLATIYAFKMNGR